MAPARVAPLRHSRGVAIIGGLDAVRDSNTFALWIENGDPRSE
jgi:hypothetical protein